MTTPNHGVQSGIIAYTIYPRWWFALIAIILGIMPDVGRLFQKDKTDWSKFYVPAHDFINRWYLLLIPFWNIHILEDYFVHNQSAPYGWKWWTIYAEITIWILCVLVIWRMII